MLNSEAYIQFLEKNGDYQYRLEQNTYVVESIGLLYMDTPKTAGTSIKTRLAQIEAHYVQPEESLSLETVSEMFIHDRSANPLRPITDYSLEKQQEMLYSDQWKRICVVRNPYDRLFSAWFSKLLLRQPGYMEAVPGYQLPEMISHRNDVYRLFEDFVIYLSKYGCISDPHWDCQTRLLFHDTISWGRTFKFEKLQAQLLEDVKFFGGNEIVLDKLNVSGFSPDWNSVSERTIELIQLIYKSDFEYYGYSSVPPKNGYETDMVVTYVNAVAGRSRRLHGLILRNREDKRALDILRDEKQALRARLENVESQLCEVESQLREVISSRSWKVTLPIRILLDFIKSFLGKI